MNEEELVNLFYRHMSGLGYKCEKVSHSTSKKGWDITITDGKDEIGVEVKYFKGPKVSSFGSLMISMLGERPEMQKVYWLFNADRGGHIDKYYEYEFMIYFAEQLADERRGKYWKPFLQDVALLYIYDGREQCFYWCAPNEYTDLSKKWLKIVEERKYEPYLNKSPKLKQKILQFKEEILPMLKKEMLKQR